MSYGKARVHLMTLSVRTSGKGNSYLAGWLGKASVVAFMGEPDKFGNETWDVYVTTPEPRQDATQGRDVRQRARDLPRQPPRLPRPATGYHGNQAKSHVATSGHARWPSAAA